MTTVVAIGECMLEFKQQQPGLFVQSAAGDIYNFLVYLKRLRPDVNARLFTALGKDRYSDQLLQTWQREAIDTSLVYRIDDKLPGLYLIDVDDQGERHFYYWRENSAARDVLRCYQQSQNAFDFNNTDYFYFSGISLAILDDDSRTVLWQLIEQLKQRGTRIVFDPNYRPKLWPDIQQARDIITQAYSLSDILLPSYEDEQMLFGKQSQQQVLDRLSALGASEIVLTNGANTIVGSDCGQAFSCDPAKSEQVVDTTSAGDSFNAGYLSQRLAGEPPLQAAAFASSIAAIVVAHRGAIVPDEPFNNAVAALL